MAYIVLTCLLGFLVEAAWACTEQVTPLRNLEVRSRLYSASDPPIDDFYLDDGWFTVNNQRGQYAMVDKVPKYGTCGTNSPIFLKDSHPKVDSETPIDVEACLKTEFDNCATTYHIRIRMCGNILQYYLVTTMDFSAYCFDPPELHDVSDIAAAPTDVNLGNIHVTPELHHRIESFDGADSYFPYLEFTCTFEKQIPYFYTVTWFINLDRYIGGNVGMKTSPHIGVALLMFFNGKLFETYGPAADKFEQLKLTEERIVKETPTIGFNLRCGVRVSKDSFGLTTKSEYSPEFFAGLKIANPHVEMGKSEELSIELLQTVPIGCRYRTETTDCFIKLAMVDPQKYKCQEGNIMFPSRTPRCGLNLKALKRSDTWNEAGVVHTFQVTTKDETYEDRKIYKLHLETNNFEHKIWQHYKPSEIQVAVLDDRTYEKKKCYSHVDPHMRTADGRHYENQRIGDFMLYKNKKFDIEVHERVKPCYAGNVFCACALGVRAGADIFMINICGGTVKFVEFRSCKDGETLTVVERTPTHYEIITPIGTRIDAFFIAGRYLNIDITMAPKDTRNTKGLCGVLDGNINNDFEKRDGTLSDSQTFANDWRLRPDESVFLKNNFPSWTAHNEVFCVCEQAFDDNIESGPSREAVCAPSMDLVCKRPGADTNKICTITTRQKRSILDKMHREVERKLNKRISVKPLDIAKRQAISESDARKHCAGKINGSLAFTQYADFTANENPDDVIEQCVFDVQAVNDLSFAGIHVDAVNAIVSKSFDYVPGYVANNTDTVTYFKENSCPNNCSERGSCTNEGKCECNTYYHGAQCEIDDRIAPEIVDTVGDGICDLQDGDGCTCLSFSTEYLLENFTCEMSGQIIYDNGDIENITETHLGGQHEDIFSGVCCVPETRYERSVTDRAVFAVRYDLSISNNGQNFGNQESILVLDSACQTPIVNQDGTQTVVLKDGVCFIDGECRLRQTANVVDDCFVCDPDTSSGNWTYVCVPTTDENKTGIILGTTLGVGLALGCLVVAFLVWKFKGKPALKKRKSVGDSQVRFSEPYSPPEGLPTSQ